MKKGSKVLITGAAGFIGSHLAKRLHSESYTIVGLDDLSAGNIENLAPLRKSDRFSFVKEDILNPRALSKVFRDVDVIFHLAACSSIPKSMDDPVHTFKVNVEGTVNVLEQARKSDGSTVIFASSSTVYGQTRTLPTPEDHPIAPISNYGATKAAGEAYVCSYHYLYGLKTASLRYYNIYGPEATKGVTFDFLRKIQKDPTKLEILGTGKQKKDYLFVNDAIDASLLVASKGRLTGEAYNVGSGENYTVKEIAQMLSNILGLIPEIHCTGGLSWKGDVQTTLADTSKLEGLGFRKKIDFRKGLEILTDWYTLKYEAIKGR